MLDFETPPDSSWDALAPELEIAAAKGRAEFWNSSLKPHDAFEVYLLDQVAVQSVRIDQCQHQGRAIRRLHAKRARLRWAEDRRNAAEALGARLSRDPARIAHKLDGTKQGCEWLIGRWEGLGGVLEAAGDWDKAQASMALDLLGVPAELRTFPNAADGDAESRLGLVRGQVDRLQSLIARAMVELDDCEREMAVMGFGPDLDGQLGAVYRLERSCSRRLEWSRNQLRSYRKGPRPDGTGSGPGSHRLGPHQMPAPPPPPPVRKSEDQWRQETIARAATRQAVAEPTSDPAPEFAPAPAPDPEPSPQPEPVPVLRGRPRTNPHCLHGALCNVTPPQQRLSV